MTRENLEPHWKRRIEWKIVTDTHITRNDFNSRVMIIIYYYFNDSFIIAFFSCSSSRHRRWYFVFVIFAIYRVWHRGSAMTVMDGARWWEKWKIWRLGCDWWWQQTNQLELVEALKWQRFFVIFVVVVFCVQIQLVRDVVEYEMCVR